MATVTGSRIQEAAEAAVRRAAGDWQEASRLLREQLDTDDQLRDELLGKSMRRELREAALRLGAGTVLCVACGEEIPLDAQICHFCGHEPGASVSVGPQIPSKKPTGGPIIRHFTLLTGWILIVLIVILIISFNN